MDRGPLHGIVELSEHGVVARATPQLVDHFDHADVAAGHLKTPEGCGELGRSAEHPHHHAVGPLVVLVGAERRQGQFREEVDQRDVAVEAARNALHLRAVAGGLDHAEQPILGPDPVAQRRLGLGPQADLRNHVEIVDQRIAQPNWQLAVRVEDLLPGQNAPQERLVPRRQQLRSLRGIGIVLGVHVRVGVRRRQRMAPSLPVGSTPGEDEADDLLLPCGNREIDRRAAAGLRGFGRRQRLCDADPCLLVGAELPAKAELFLAHDPQGVAQRGCPDLNALKVALQRTAFIRGSRGHLLDGRAGEVHHDRAALRLRGHVAKVGLQYDARDDRTPQVSRKERAPRAQTELNRGVRLVLEVGDRVVSPVMDLFGQLDLCGATLLEQVDRPRRGIEVGPDAVRVSSVAPVTGQVPTLVEADGHDLQVHADVVAAHGRHFEAQVDTVPLPHADLKGSQASASHSEILRSR